MRVVTWIKLTGKSVEQMWDVLSITTNDEMKSLKAMCLKFKFMPFTPVNSVTMVVSDLIEVGWSIEYNAIRKSRDYVYNIW